MEPRGSVRGNPRQAHQPPVALSRAVPRARPTCGPTSSRTSASSSWLAWGRSSPTSPTSQSICRQQVKKTWAWRSGVPPVQSADKLPHYAQQSPASSQAAAPCLTQRCACCVSRRHSWPNEGVRAADASSASPHPRACRSQGTACSWKGRGCCCSTAPVRSGWRWLKPSGRCHGEWGGAQSSSTDSGVHPASGHFTCLRPLGAAPQTEPGCRAGAAARTAADSAAAAAQPCTAGRLQSHAEAGAPPRRRHSPAAPGSGHRCSRALRMQAACGAGQCLPSS